LVWIRLDDSFYDNPKVEPLSDRAYRLWTYCMGYSGRHLTDGFVPGYKVHELAHTRRSQRYIDELVERRFLEPRGDGYIVHDFLKHNPTREQVEKDRENNAKRQADYQAKKKQGANASNNGVNNGVENYAPSRPVPGIESNNRDSKLVAESDRANAPGPAAISPLKDPRVSKFHEHVSACKGYSASLDLLLVVQRNYASRLDLEEQGLKIKAWAKKHPRLLCSDDFILNWLSGELHPETRRKKGNGDDHGTAVGHSDKREGADPSGDGSPKPEWPEQRNFD
jgi:hypothetical protein